MKRWHAQLLAVSLPFLALVLFIGMHDARQEAENRRLLQEIRNRESERAPVDNPQSSGAVRPTAMPPDYIAPDDTDTHAGKTVGLAVGDSAEKAGPILARGHLMDRIVLSGDRYAEIRVFPGDVIVRV